MHLNEKLFILAFIFTIKTNPPHLLNLLMEKPGI